AQAARRSRVDSVHLDEAVGQAGHEDHRERNADGPVRRVVEPGRRRLEPCAVEGKPGQTTADGEGDSESQEMERVAKIGDSDRTHDQRVHRERDGSPIAAQTLAARRTAKADIYAPA